MGWNSMAQGIKRFDCDTSSLISILVAGFLLLVLLIHVAFNPFLFASYDMLKLKAGDLCEAVKKIFEVAHNTNTFDCSRHT